MFLFIVVAIVVAAVALWVKAMFINPLNEHPNLDYDGKFYSNWLDVQLVGVHSLVAKEVGAVDSVLDACCGTGQLCMTKCRLII
jgi:hypothetical protein